MKKIKIGKYTVTHIDTTFFQIEYNGKKYILNANLREQLILKGEVNLTEEEAEKQITHSLKMERIRLQRDLSKLESIL